MPSALTLPVSVNQSYLLAVREWAQLNSSKFRSEIVLNGFECRGAIDSEALENALAALVAQHCGLTMSLLPCTPRTGAERANIVRAFGPSGLVPTDFYCQVRSEQAKTPITLLDLSGLSSGVTIHDEIGAVCAREVATGFDYELPPLLRMSLLKLGGDVHLLLLAIDHIVADRASMALMWRDFWRYYRAYANGEKPYQEAGSRNSLFYPEWEREMVKTGAFDPAVQFWRDQWVAFGGARIGYSDLAFHDVGGKQPSGVGSCKMLELAEDIRREIKDFSAASGYSLYMICFAALSAILAAYTKKSKIALSGHLANRATPNFLNYVGFISTFHLLGLDFTQVTSVTSLLDQTKRVVLDAIRHQAVPIQVMWQQLKCCPQNGDARIILSIVADKVPASWGGESLSVEPAALPDWASYQALGISVHDSTEGMAILAKFPTDRFTSQGIEWLLEDFAGAIVEMVRFPDRMVSQCTAGRDRWENWMPPEANPMERFVIVGSDLLPATSN